jgi:hypothetical protein
MTIGYILLAIALAEFALGLWFIFAYRRQQSTFWYGLFALGVAIYVGANGLGYSQLASASTAEHLAWAGGMLTAVFILPFSYSFPLARRSTRELLPWIIWPLTVVIPGVLFTGLFVGQVFSGVYGRDYTTPLGPYFIIMMLFFATYWIWGIANIIKSYIISDGIHRSQLKMLIIGLGSSVVLASLFDIVFPLIQIVRFGFLGSLFSAIWLGFTSYILVKK